MQTLYTALKVNNEVELCEIATLDAKQQVEKVLLQHRISYFIKWPKPKLFSRRKTLCIICINENSKDDAEMAIQSLGDDVVSNVHFTLRKSENEFL